MDFMEISKKRVTVRKFSQKPVEDEKIEKILEAGRWSPTAVNLQPQRIMVLNTPESLDKVRQFCSYGYDQKYVDLAKECDDKGNGKVNFYYGAPLVLFAAYDKTACWTHPQSGKSSGATDATIVCCLILTACAQKPKQSNNATTQQLSTMTKTLIVEFSATGHTMAAAQKLAKCMYALHRLPIRRF